MKQHIINTDNDPRINDGYSIKEHKKSGSITWDPSKVKLYLDEWQCDNQKVITGYELYEKLSDLVVLNENVLNYLLENQELIHDTWKRNSDKEPLQIFFWGTIYHNKGGDLVRYLKWSSSQKKWKSVYTWLEFQLFRESPAAVLTTK